MGSARSLEGWGYSYKAYLRRLESLCAPKAYRYNYKAHLCGLNLAHLYKDAPNLAPEEGLCLGSPTLRLVRALPAQPHTELVLVVSC